MSPATMGSAPGLKPSADPVPEQFQMIADVPITLRAELGRHTITIRRLLELKVGDVLSLPKAMGENIDIYTGDALIGSAEVLVMDGIMGIQIADLCDAPDVALTTRNK